MITVIIGPPCAGKSTYTQSHAAQGDVVVDFDRIAKAFGATESHDASDAVKKVAFKARASAIADIIKGIEVDAWIIHTNPPQSWIKQYEDVDASVVTLDPGIDECLQRASDDARPEWTAQAIRDWYDHRELKTPKRNHAALDFELLKLGAT